MDNSDPPLPLTDSPRFDLPFPSASEVPSLSHGPRVSKASFMDPEPSFRYEEAKVQDVDWKRGEEEVAALRGAKEIEEGKG